MMALIRSQLILFTWLINLDNNETKLRIPTQYHGQTLRRSWILSPAWSISSYLRLVRSSRSFKLRSVDPFSSVRSNSAVFIHVDMIFWICSTLSFDFCRRLSRSWTWSRVSMMYSQVPGQNTSRFTLGHFPINTITLAHSCYNTHRFTLQHLHISFTFTNLHHNVYKFINKFTLQLYTFM